MSISNYPSSPTQQLSVWYAKAVIPVSDKTATKYQRCYRMLQTRTALALGVEPADVTPTQILNDLDTDPTLAIGTKCVYRSAIVWALNQPDYDFHDQDRSEGLEAVRDFNPRLSRSKDKIADVISRRSRESARFIPEADLKPILDGLLSANRSKQDWAAKTTTWLIAGLATGARPGEWENAYWQDRERGILRLPNAKLKKQPPIAWAHIPQRLLTRAEADLAAMAEADPGSVTAVLKAAECDMTLVARNFAFFDEAEARTDPANEIAFESLRRLRAWELHNAGLAWRDIAVHPRRIGAVDGHLHNVQAYLAGGSDQTFKRLYDGCRKALTTACELMFEDGRLYSLYDTRSTAAANIKATFDPEVAAMLMGHYMKRRRSLKHYAGPEHAFRRGGRFAPRAADTQKQSEQVEQGTEQASGPVAPSDGLSMPTPR
ncbi:hypothetical protein WKW77_11790 [Variovorax ureilyticus]|uniref:Phage integrase family protein n=1 Tax=Variovorax ureilyticus TaxID=1836198 RepID=A0ABU8VE40_9BURK